MKKIFFPIIIGIIATIGLTVSVGIMYTDKPIFNFSPAEKPPIVENNPGLGHPDAITSGPLTITKYSHKIYENVFIIVSGLKPDDKGNIRIFMPDGRLYKTLQYDGEKEDSFNSYFRPDTSKTREICEQEELVGRWRVLFDNNAYPPLVFEIINEHLNGPNVRLQKSC